MNQRFGIPFLSSLLATAALTSACTGGERSQSGECPADEECSDLTPKGLEFLGAELHDFPLQAGPLVTGVGGAQTIRLDRRDENNDQIALEFDFDAVTDNGDALTAAPGNGPEVILTGNAEGADLLRITEAGTDLLFDRTEVQAQTIAAARIAPAGLEAYDETSTLTVWLDEPSFGVELLGSDDERLVDETVGADIGGTSGVKAAWDVIGFSAVPGPAAVTISTGNGTEFSTSIDVVETIDELVPERDTFDAVIDVGESGELCFDALAGGTPVVSLTWSFTATGAVTLGEAVENGCVAITFDAAGDATITAEAGGLMTDTLLSTGALAAKRASRATPGASRPAPLVLRATAGERARNSQ